MGERCFTATKAPTCARQFATPPPPHHHITDQVLALTIENTSSLSMSGIPPSNALYPIYEVTLTAEMGVYLKSMDPQAEARSELIVAMSDCSPAEVVGFVHYLPLRGSADACGVTYIAVAQHARRQGVARALMDEVRKAYPHIGLSCPIEKVEIFEKLGLQVVGANHNHVEMNTDEEPTPGAIGVLDVEPLFHSPEVLDLQAKLVMKHKRSGLKQAQQELARLYHRDCSRVASFVQDRKAT